MRFKKGSKVEVFCQNEKPAGSWRYGEIIYGNGHSYTIKYDMGEFDELIEERVSRKLLRPPPPLLVLPENWKPGDVVEVLQNWSWKMATVSKVLVRDRFLVRLVGSFSEFEVSTSAIRVRQSWLNDKWVVLGESPMKYGNKESNRRRTIEHNPISWSQVNAPNLKINLQEKHDHVIDEKNINFQSSHNFSSRSLKRNLPYCPKAEACRQKLRVTERDGKCHPGIVEGFRQLPEKVETNAFAGEMLGKSRTKKRSLCDVDEERMKRNSALGCSVSLSFDPNKATCSAGCSSVGSNDPFNSCYRLVYRGEDANDHTSDAESVCWSYDEERNRFLCAKEEMAAEIHRLELHAYRCTMEALHASGPLSWEQETMITNLRISLHISNDEHLMELRNLISNSSGTPIS